MYTVAVPSSRLTGSLGFLRALLLAAPFAWSACSGSAPVHIRAFLPSGVPLVELEIAALPFDADGLLDSLAHAARTPAPAFPGIERQMEGYHRPEGAPEDGTLAGASRATRDSLERLGRTLSRMDRHAPGYREAYAGFRELYSRYAAREAAREGQVRKLFSADRHLAEQASRASDSLRAWEREAYRAFPRLAQERVGRSGRQVLQWRTDSLGSADPRLPVGGWWLTARLPDPDNPFREFRWYVPVTVSAGLPFAVPFMGGNAAHRWRH